MKLSEILAISGQPGLYKYVAQCKGGIIVEALSDGKRFSVAGNARVSSLADIAIFTTGEDLPLGEVLQKIFEKAEGEAVVSVKGLSNGQIKTMMSEYLPDYDEDRVHVSDMKKLFNWYNILTATGFTTFVEEEEEVAEQEEEVVAE